MNVYQWTALALAVWWLVSLALAPVVGGRLKRRWGR